MHSSFHKALIKKGAFIPVFALLMSFLLFPSSLYSQEEESDEAVGAPTGLFGFPPPPTLDGYEPSLEPRDFRGTWVYKRRPGVPPFQLMASIPYNESALEKVKHRDALFANGTPVASNLVMCRPGGVFNLVTPNVPIYISQNNEKVVFTVINEIRDVRQVYFSSTHPENIIPSYTGDSIARWDGDTLIVDTIGYNGTGDVDNGKAFHSDKLHVTQKINKTEDGLTLLISTTLNDPETYTEAITVEREWSWIAGQQPLEFDCEENPREDNYAGLVFENEILEPICVLYEGEGLELSAVRCEAP